jgi:tripeptide aminopeptidase
MTEQRLLETFLDLVCIDSPSREEGAVAEYARRALDEAGCAVRSDDSSARTGSDTGNLIAELPGDTERVLVLSAHMDCVEPCRGVEPRIVDGVIAPAGDTVLGGDDKAGVAAVIEAIRRVSASTLPRPTVRAVFTVAEEIGLVGAKELDRAAVAGDLCLVLDADGAPGGIVIGAPTQYTFIAEFEGRPSHAGVEPEKGVSAIRMASASVLAMELGRLDAETTANVGTITGGTATNVVPATVRMTGECRSLDRERVEQVRTAMEAQMERAADAAGGFARVEWTREYEGFRFAEDDPRLGIVRAACADVGLQPRTFESGGGSDANIISALGVPTVALSCGMGGVHSTEERLAVDDLNALARLVEAVSLRLGQE